MGTKFRTLGLAKEQWEGAIMTSSELRFGKLVPVLVERMNGKKARRRTERRTRGFCSNPRRRSWEPEWTGTTRTERKNLILETEAVGSTGVVIDWMWELRGKGTRAMVENSGLLTPGQDGVSVGRPSKVAGGSTFRARRDSQPETISRHLGAEE